MRLKIKVSESSESIWIWRPLWVWTPSLSLKWIICLKKSQSWWIKFHPNSEKVANITMSKTCDYFGELCGNLPPTHNWSQEQEPWEDVLLFCKLSLWLGHNSIHHMANSMWTLLSVYDIINNCVLPTLCQFGEGPFLFRPDSTSMLSDELKHQQRKPQKPTLLLLLWLNEGKLLQPGFFRKACFSSIWTPIVLKLYVHQVHMNMYVHILLAV